jgi:hypothetical protein
MIEDSIVRPPYWGPASKKFEATYFSKGKVYHLFSKQAIVGNFAVREVATYRELLYEPVIVSADGNLQTKKKLMDNESLIASTVGAFKLKPEEQLQLDPALEETALAIGKEILYKHGITDSTFLRKASGMRYPHRWYKFDLLNLYNDQRRQLAITFRITTEQMYVTLFLLLEHLGEGYEPTIEIFSDEIGLSSITVEFLDQIDLEDDSIDELFVREGYYEGHGVSIYKNISGKWTKIYNCRL